MEMVEALAALKSNIDDSYLEIQQVCKDLVGHQIVFIRGKNQRVFAEVTEWIPQSLRIKVSNFDTGRKYEVDITKVEILKIILKS